MKLGSLRSLPKSTPTYRLTVALRLWPTDALSDASSSDKSALSSNLGRSKCPLRDWRAGRSASD